MKRFTAPLFYFISFIVFTLLVKTVDLQPAGAEGTLIGFANLNLSVQQLFGQNHLSYKITQIFGILALITAAVFAITGIVQMFKRKSLLKVDSDILLLGLIYLLLVILYILFEKLAINYRPVVLDEGLEPSYPSTHTMLILTVFGTCMRISRSFISSKKLQSAIIIFCLVIMELTVVFRMICGVHWFTDIIGGVLISFCLITLYNSLINFTLFLSKKKL